jgi:hypothetical protein
MRPLSGLLAISPSLTPQFKAAESIFTARRLLELPMREERDEAHLAALLVGEQPEGTGR